MKDIRLGNGYDVHAFEPGNQVILCGLTIPYTAQLKGHSDADVAMHAITDALYGALAVGDIGRHFPPSDPQWKGAASAVFLKHAAALVATHGFYISNIDCTIICEMPKIGPNFGHFANDCAVDIADIKAMGCHQSCSMLQKNCTGCTFPLRVRGWKVASNIPHGQRAVKRVGYGMHRDIGI